MQGFAVLTFGIPIAKHSALLIGYAQEPYAG